MVRLCLICSSSSSIYSSEHRLYARSTNDLMTLCLWLLGLLDIACKYTSLCVDFRWILNFSSCVSLRIIASEARRARRASLASQGEGAPVQCIGFWTSDISENMHFRHMVHRDHFCLFSPKYQRYIIKKVTRPDHNALCAPISRKVLKLRKIFIWHKS